jgi:hypothetical protein
VHEKTLKSAQFQSKILKGGKSDASVRFGDRVLRKSNLVVQADVVSHQLNTLSLSFSWRYEEPCERRYGMGETHIIC